MKVLLRWYGETDSIPLQYIKHIPNINGIVSAIYDVPVGEVWSVESIQKLKDTITQAGLSFEVIESVPVHEDIKLGLPSREQYIANYKQNIINLSKAGIKVICYNFMPVFDWTRSTLDYTLPDGSSALAYEASIINNIDIKKTNLSLPGWDSSYTREELNAILDKYSKITEEDLWNNLKYFLSQIIPVAEEVRVKMAIHPDDPPWSIFGLPRIITSEKSLDRFLSLVNSDYNGLTFCTGSLGASPKNDCVAMIKKFAKKIHFAHLRNIKVFPDGSFTETSHLSSDGSIDMYEVLKAYYSSGFRGYVRPDHGRMIFGETGKPGYGLYDRALGIAYINGIWESLVKGDK